ncbi:MAG: hypothetical protein ABIA11_02405 [Patescibacteria group bacterium]|nr:hypothetical protein [Patescibacteria group bacterium]
MSLLAVKVACTPRELINLVDSEKGIKKYTIGFGKGEDVEITIFADQTELLLASLKKKGIKTISKRTLER